jgi:uncharacterized protein (DUF58 family)
VLFRSLYIPPRKGQKHALRVIREVLTHGQTRPAGPMPRAGFRELPRRLWRWWKERADRARREPRRATSIAAALELCGQVLPRRTVLFLISDFFDDGYLQALRGANRKHDVVAALVTDPRELEMPPAGLVQLEDAETGRHQLVDTQSEKFRAELARLGAARRQRLEEELRASRIDLITFDAAGSMVDPLLRFFRQRERRIRR